MIRWIQPGDTGVDFSYSKPPPAVLVDLGFDFVVGYISPNPRKNLLNPLDYINAGLGVLFVYEVTATTPNGGRARGLIDGADAKRQLEALGQPYDVPFLIAFDTNTTAANIAAHIAYFNAFAEVCAPYFAGAYMDTDLAPYVEEAIGWLPLAWSWSGSSKADAIAKATALGFHVLQQQGYYIDGQWAVDPNLCIKAFTTWGTPVAPPSIPESGNDMAEVLVNRDAGKYSAVPFNPATGGWSVWVLIGDEEGLRKKQCNLSEFYALGYANGTYRAIPLDDVTLDALPNWEPKKPVVVTVPPINVPAPVIPPLVIPALRLQGTLGAGGIITATIVP